MKIIIILVLLVSFSANAQTSIGKPFLKTFKEIPIGVEMHLLNNIASFRYPDKCIQTVWFNKKGMITDFKEICPNRIPTASLYHEGGSEIVSPFLDQVPDHYWQAQPLAMPRD